MAEPQATEALSTPVVSGPDGLEAEADDWDGDSALGEVNIASSTTSMTSSILRYRQENGRTYHAYKDGKYGFPNDEQERDRLDLQHHLFFLTLDGKLFTAPIPKTKQLHRVLDVGTGTGIWAIDFADEHPETQVIGIDLSPIQPQFIPSNVMFEVDDLEETWAFNKSFDFIFARMTVGAFADSPRFFQQSFEHLVPGGWIECMDICNPIKADDSSMTSDTALLQWSHFMLKGCTELGISANSPMNFKAQMEAAGFVNVTQTVYKWPSNRWPKSKKFKELGLWAFQNIEPGLEGLSLAVFTRGLKWSKEETEVFLAGVRKDLKDTRIHAYWEIYNVTGQKPL